MSLKVSIVTVSYNCRKTIEQTLLSVLGQSYSNIEYIVIDGNSTDGTTEILKRYEDRLAVYLSEDDKGIYDAMNKGISYATGDIIGILNSDDWYDKDTVKKVVQCFEESGSDVVYGEMMVVYPHGYMHKWKTLSLEAIKYTMNMPHPTVFIKRVLYSKYGLFNCRYKVAADYELLLRLYNYGVTFSYIPSVLAFFRTGGVSSKLAALCVEETKEISIYYLNKKDEAVYGPKIEERYIRQKELVERQLLLESVVQTDKLMIQEIISSMLGNADTVAVFGAGVKGRECYAFLKDIGFSISVFLDNDKQKWGKSFLGLKIESPESIVANKKKVIIATTKYVKDISNQLETMGYEEDKDFITFTSIIDTVISKHKVRW